MKLTIFTAICVFVIAISQATNEIGDDTKKLITDIRQHCLNTVKIPLEKIDKFNQRQYDDNDDEIKEYMMCVAKKEGMFDENGEFRKSDWRPKLITLVGEETADKIMQECMNRNEDTVREKMWMYTKCAHKYWTSSYPVV